MKTILTRLIPGGILALGLLAVPVFGQAITPGQQAPTLQQNTGQEIQQGVPQQQFQQGVPQTQQGLQQSVPQQQQQLQQPQVQTLSKANLRDIDRLVVQLTQYTKALHDQQHAHLEGQRHAEKLDTEVTALERMADGLHQFAIQADGGQQSVLRMRQDTNEFLQLSFRISRTIDLTQPWLRGNQAQNGVTQMRSIARGVTGVALQIDQFLPVDPGVIDGQTERLEAAIKELHDEFHEHLEGYEVSRHLDEDLEEVETLVEHMHELAHNKSWGQINLQHITEDLNQIKQKTAHIESLFVRQAEIGVRQQDWVGIEHSRDAITDVLASAYLLEHMIRKTQPVNRHQTARPNLEDRRPMRDRHGHPVNPVRDRHTPLNQHNGGR